MHDITHCCGQDCPLNQTCLRCTAIVVGRQDFFTRLYYNFETAHCDYYWDERPSEDKIRQRAYQLWEQNGCEMDKAEQHWFQARNELIENLRNS